IHDVADAVDVDAARSNVGGDQRKPLPLGNCANNRSAWVCGLFPLVAGARVAAFGEPAPPLSAPGFVRVNTSARPIDSRCKISARTAGFAARSTRMMRCSTRSTVEATGVTAILAGLRNM